MSLVLLLLAACGSPPEPAVEAPAEPVAEAPPPADPHAGHTTGELGPFQPLSGAVPQKVFFVSPAEGATVPSPVKVVFGVEGLTVQPAGPLAPDAGHHHIIVDEAAPEAGLVVPKDDRHIHYGQGQTEAELPLSPGPHTLTLQFADGLHRSYGPAATAQIHIVVETPPAIE